MDTTNSNIKHQPIPSQPTWHKININKQWNRVSGLTKMDNTMKLAKMNIIKKIIPATEKITVTDKTMTTVVNCLRLHSYHYCFFSYSALAFCAHKLIIIFTA